MSLELLFQPEAEAEFDDAIDRYEAQLPGLGEEFSQEVLQAVKRVRLHPERFLQVRGGVQCIKPKRFHAYRIYFTIDENILSVIAVFHGARDPAELRRRFK